ncbi:5994_t:CDS:2, partial [Gigaspora rosea]
TNRFKTEKKRKDEPKDKIDSNQKDNEVLVESDQETLVENDDTNKEKKDRTGRLLEEEVIRLACENWTRRVNEFRKPISNPEEPIQKKLTEVQEVGNGYQSEIETIALGWKPKSAEGLEKVFKTWSKKRDEFQYIIKHQRTKPKKERVLYLTNPKKPKYASYTNSEIGIEADIDEPKNRTSNSIRPRLNPKKRKKKDWLETINNINMTNKIIRKKTLQRLLPYRPNLQIFDPGRGICCGIQS